MAGARQQRPGGIGAAFEPQLLSAASTFAMPTLCISTATRESVLGCAMSVCRSRTPSRPDGSRETTLAGLKPLYLFAWRSNALSLIVTGVPLLTRLASSSASQLVSLMQP